MIFVAGIFFVSLHWCKSVCQTGSSGQSWNLWGLLFPETIFTHKLSWKALSIYLESFLFFPWHFFYHLTKPSYKEEGNCFSFHSTDQISELIDCGDTVSIERVKMGCSSTFKLQALSCEPQSLFFSVFKVFLIEAEMNVAILWLRLFFQGRIVIL